MTTAHPGRPDGAGSAGSDGAGATTGPRPDRTAGTHRPFGTRRPPGSHRPPHVHRATQPEPGHDQVPWLEWAVRGDPPPGPGPANVPGQRPSADPPAGSGPLTASFEAEIGAALRYESGLVWKALAVLAALAVLLVLRAVYHW